MLTDLIYSVTKNWNLGGGNFTLFIGAKRKLGAVLIVWDMCHNTES